MQREGHMYNEYTCIGGQRMGNRGKTAVSHARREAPKGALLMMLQLRCPQQPPTSLRTRATSKHVSASSLASVAFVTVA